MRKSGTLASAGVLFSAGLFGAYVGNPRLQRAYASVDTDCGSDFAAIVSDDTDLRGALNDPNCTTITVDGPITLLSNLPTIVDDSWVMGSQRESVGLTLRGTGDDTIDGAGFQGVTLDLSNVGSNVLLAVSDLTMTNMATSGPGAALSVDLHSSDEDRVSIYLCGSTFADNHAVGDGGAIYASSNIYGDGDVFVNAELCREGSTFSGNSTDGQGGAIKAANITIAGENAFVGNYAQDYGGAASASYVDVSGGVLFMDDSAGDVGGALYLKQGGVIDQASFVGNYTANQGGAIYNSSPNSLLYISNTTFDGNISRFDGGAITSIGGNLAISESSFVRNEALAESGGAIYMSVDELLVANTFIGENSAGFSGGIHSLSEVSLLFSTVYNNTSTYDDSATEVGASTLTVIGSAIGSRTASNVIDVDHLVGSPYGRFSVVSEGTPSAYDDTVVSVDPGGLGLGDLDGSGPGEPGRPPAGPTSPLVSSAPSGDDSSLGTGITVDQLEVPRGPSFTIGSRQFVPPNPPSPSSFAPSAPLAVRATAGDRSATMSWDAPASSGSFPITNYRVVASPGGQSCLANAPARSCVVSGLTNGTPYTFTVEALNGAGWSPQSAPSNPVVPSSNARPPGPEPLPGPLAPGDSSLVVDDSMVPGLTVTPNAQDNGLDVAGPGFTMTLGGLGVNGRPLPLGDRRVLVLDAERDVRTTGTGFEPGSLVGLYVDPPSLVRNGERALRDLAAGSAAAAFLGTVTVAQDGSFSGTKTLPASVLAGDHVIQAVGFGPGGVLRSINLGIEVRGWIALDKGKRVDAGRYDRIRASGDTGGVAVGAKLAPYIRSRGQDQFARGKATITVKADGTFTWGRKIRSQKSLAAYVAYRDVRSNTVVWARVR